MIAHKNYTEKRKDPRLENNIPIKLSKGDGDVVTETANISRSGAYCRITGKIELMTKLKIQLLLPMGRKKSDVTKKIVCSGVIVRCEPSSPNGSYDVAIFFNDITQRDAETIADYVSIHLEHNINS